MAWYDQVYLWTGFSVLIASAFIGLAYMLSQILRLSVLEAWVKIELHELVGAMIIAVFCVSLIAGVNNAAQFLTGSHSTDIINATRTDFLQGELYSDGQALYKNMVGVYFEVAKVTSYSYTAGLSLGVMSIGVSSTPAAGLAPLQSEVGQGIDGVANFMLLAAAQSAFLMFFSTAAVYMLPVGIFLRSFSLTRKAGGVVLASVIATSVIYPASMLLTREIYDEFRPGLQSMINQVSVDQAPQPPLASVVCSESMKEFVSSPIPIVGGELGWFLVFCGSIGWFVPFFCSAAWYQIISVLFYIVNSLFPLAMYVMLMVNVAKFESNLWANSGGSYYAKIYNYAMPAVSQYSVLSLISFLIPVVITVSLLRNLTVMFGGEPQLYGLSKLV